ncbi:MAG: aminomethyl-transferring glycine dehydrogenase subunit GcvPA [Paramuribaculum sp.]|nr:aminomethyl-transferring glycine dehydrogenase subunit GcvPA [Paramuribaculum sp.]
MVHRYFPHTPEDIDAMLRRCGVGSMEELYSDVPAELLMDGDYDVPAQMSEKEVRDYFLNLDEKNARLVCFAGAGYYEHYKPAVIDSLLSRSEFLTAYTPYQPEISQGTLQYIFEYQSMMAELTGLPVSNASMYDGATATAEAMMMTVAAARKRNRVLVSATLSPAVRKVVDTYAHYHGVKIDVIPAINGVTDMSAAGGMLSAGDVAGVIVATPNYYGIVEDYSGLADMCHGNKALLVMNCVPADLAVLKTPGEWGADIACGDAQSLGMPLSFGGPYLGFLCARKELMRKMPGRIVGATKDADGRRVFVLTLQAREQHIRRDKATSNICSNQGLMALHTAVYLSVMGAKGLRDAALAGYDGAHYLADKLIATGKAEMVYPQAHYFNEFALRLPGVDIDRVIRNAVQQGYLPGVKISDDTLLIAVTEMQTRAQLDRLVSLLTESV